MKLQELLAKGSRGTACKKFRGKPKVFVKAFGRAFGKSMAKPLAKPDSESIISVCLCSGSNTVAEHGDVGVVSELFVFFGQFF